jgi:hypothetical protein
MYFPLIRWKMFETYLEDVDEAVEQIRNNRYSSVIEHLGAAPRLLSVVDGVRPICHQPGFHSPTTRNFKLGRVCVRIASVSIKYNTGACAVTIFEIFGGT